MDREELLRLIREDADVLAALGEVAAACARRESERVSELVMTQIRDRLRHGDLGRDLPG